MLLVEKQAMDDTDPESRNSSFCCCFRLRHRSNRKITATSVQEDQVSRPAEQTVCEPENNPILKEKDCIDKQQSREDDEIDSLRAAIRRLNDELEWFLPDSFVDSWVPNTLGFIETVGNLSQTKGQKGPSPNDEEQQFLPTTYSNFVTDIIGARASPVELVSVSSISASDNETPPASPLQPLPSQGRTHAKPPRPANGLLMSYTEIFHILVGHGLITPLPSETNESFLHSDTAYLQSCEYHQGNRGHSTENCIQLRFQVQKLMKDGLLKIEPPKLVVVDQNISSVPSSNNISSDPGSLQVVNEKESGHNIVKEESHLILQEMNSPNMPQEQINKKQEHTSDQTVPKEQYHQVFQEMNSLKNQLSLISRDVNFLKRTSEQTTGNNLSQKLDNKQAGQTSSTEQQSQPATCSSIANKYQNGEKALFSLNSVFLALFIFCCFMVTCYMCW